MQILSWKIEVRSKENEMIGPVLQLSPFPPLIQLAFTVPPCRNFWKSTYAYIHLFHFFILDSSPSNCPRSFFLLYHQGHYLFTGWNVLAALVVQRNAARPTFLTTFPECDQKLFGFQSNIFISPSSVWVTCRFCRPRFSLCLPELCHSSLPSNLLPRFTALQLLMTKWYPGSPSGAFCAKSRLFGNIKQGFVWTMGFIEWVHNIIPHRLP